MLYIILSQNKRNKKNSSSYFLQLNNNKPAKTTN